MSVSVYDQEPTARKAHRPRGAKPQGSSGWQDPLSLSACAVGRGDPACASPGGAAVAPGLHIEARLKPNPLFKMQKGPSLK